MKAWIGFFVGFVLSMTFFWLLGVDYIVDGTIVRGAGMATVVYISVFVGVIGAAICTEEAI